MIWYQQRPRRSISQTMSWSRQRGSNNKSPVLSSSSWVRIVSVLWRYYKHTFEINVSILLQNHHLQILVLIINYQHENQNPKKFHSIHHSKDSNNKQCSQSVGEGVESGECTEIRGGRRWWNNWWWRRKRKKTVAEEFYEIVQERTEGGGGGGTGTNTNAGPNGYDWFKLRYSPIAHVGSRTMCLKQTLAER